MESLEQFRSDVTEEQIKAFEKSLEMGFESHLDIHCNYWLKNQIIPLKDYTHKRVHESCNQYLSYFYSF